MVKILIDKNWVLLNLQLWSIRTRIFRMGALNFTSVEQLWLSDSEKLYICRTLLRSKVEIIYIFKQKSLNYKFLSDTICEIKYLVC